MSFTTSQGAERITDLVIAQIKAQIETALISLRADRADDKVQTPKPVEYFISDMKDPYRSPAVFVVVEETDWRKEQQGANFNSAKSPMHVSVVLEDRNATLLTRGVYRYAAALKTVLDGYNLTSTNSKIKMTVVVNRTRYSHLYTDAQVKGKGDGVFRKEAYLECDVFHDESF